MSAPAHPSEDLDLFCAEARAWLEQQQPPAHDTQSEDLIWGEGEFSVAVFPVRTAEGERAHLASLADWQQKKAERGYHAIAHSPEYGGLGYSFDHANAFGAIETEFAAPRRHELHSVTVHLIAPTVMSEGTNEQRDRFVKKFLRAEEFCCQLFSEPNAGSDLASLACKAERDGDEWVVNGQKVWTSGGVHAQWGLLIARTDPTAPKHRGLTAFLVPLDAKGATVRPIKQMSGSDSFCEVFFDDCRIPDDLRIGEVGAGWGVSLTTLAHERGNSSSGGAHKRPGGNADDAIATAKAMGRTDDPVIRQKLAQASIHERVRLLNVGRALASREAGKQPGPEGSIGKLFWVQGMPGVTDLAGAVLGMKLVADTGEWGTYGWGEHVTGAPGYRIAGGSDEIQRNIIGERVLGLPREPGVDKNTPWNEIPR